MDANHPVATTRPAWRLHVPQPMPETPQPGTDMPPPELPPGAPEPTPPEIDEPALPGEHAPVGDPGKRIPQRIH